MTSSWLLFSCAVLVLLGSVSTAGEEHEDSWMIQRPLDLSELLGEQHPVILQRMVDIPDLPNPGLRPRFHAPPPSEEYRVQFPLARPTPENLDAICLYGDRRPQYPQSYFPSSGFGQLKRQADAVNSAESWFRFCCEHNQTWASGVTQCCLQRAWTRSLKLFCKESSMVKDYLHPCCKRNGNNVFNCFNKEAVNPQYQPTEEIPAPPLSSAPTFNFDHSSCPGSEMPPSSARGPEGEKVPMSTATKVNFIFPLGRPRPDSIQSLCDNQEQRQLYNLMCLKDPEHELLKHQALTVNRMEKGFKICCKKNKASLHCAKQKWSREVDRFCANKRESLDFQCCSSKANERYNCFENLSSDPYYNTTDTLENLKLENLCDTYKIIKKKFPVGFPLAGFVARCCPLEGEEFGNCYSKKLKIMSKSICSTKTSANPAVRRCCRMPPKAFPQCMSTVLMNAINKAAKVHNKKRKCPIS